MKKIINKKSIFLFIALLIVGGVIVTAGYFYNEYQKVKKNPEVVAKTEIKSVVGSISRFMDLPKDEEPTLATITDKEKLKDQEFFKNAQNGDKVLIYTKARKAILYRPSTGRVIEFAPLVIGAPDSSTAKQPQAEPVKVAIYNGTKTVGLSSKYADKFAGISSLLVVSKTNAAKDYTETLVIDLKGGNKDIADQIGQLVDGQVVDTLPDGEIKPEADILVIVGK